MPSYELEFFWILDRGAFSDESLLDVAFDVLEAAPGARWARYDLNRLGRYKPYSSEMVRVDARTQRTALMRVEGDGGALSLIALGKHGEPPTLMVRCTLDDADTARAFALSHISRGWPVRTFGVAPRAARDAYRASGPGLNRVGEIDISTWLTGAREIGPGLSKGLQEQGVTIERDGDWSWVRLLAWAQLDPETAVERWRELAEGLSGRVGRA